MDEQHLDETSFEGDFSQVEPEDAKHLGDGGGLQAQVDRWPNGQEVEHGLVEAALSLNHWKDAYIPKNSCQVHSKERETNPGMYMFQPRDPQKEERVGMK